MLVPLSSSLRWFIPTIALLMCGCRTYDSAPINLVNHRSQVLARALESESIVDYIDRLAVTAEAPTSHVDASDGLSSFEGEWIGIVFNPNLRIARAEADVSRAAADTAGLWPDPQLSFSGAELVSPSGPLEFGLTGNLKIPISGRLGIERDRGEASFDAQRAGVVQAEWKTRLAIRAAWASWSANAERTALLHGVGDQIGRIASVTDRLEEVGELTRIEARLIRAERLRFRASLVQAEFEESRSRLALLALLGLAPSAPVELVPEFPSSGLEEPEDLLARLIECNPTLEVRQAEYEVAEQELRLAVREQFPDVQLGGGYGSEDRDDRFLFGITIPVPILNANRAKIAIAHARRDRARIAVEVAFEQLFHEMSVAREAVRAVRAQRTAFTEELVPLLDTQSREVEQLADLGEIDTLILLETVARRFEAKSQLLDLRVRELNAELDVVRLLGPELPASPIERPSGRDDVRVDTSPRTVDREVDSC